MSNQIFHRTLVISKCIHTSRRCCLLSISFHLSSFHYGTKETLWVPPTCTLFESVLLIAQLHCQRPFYRLAYILASHGHNIVIITLTNGHAGTGMKNCDGGWGEKVSSRREREIVVIKVTIHWRLIQRIRDFNPTALWIRTAASKIPNIFQHLSVRVRNDRTEKLLRNRGQF